MDINSFFKSVIDSDTAPVVICNLENTVVYMNPASIKRYRTDITGKSIKSCHNAESGEKIDRVVAWFAESKDNNIVYTSHNDKENKDVYIVALRDGKGTLIGYYEKHEYRNKETAVKQYETEAKQRWGKTDAYQEHKEKTADYTKDKWQDVNDGLMKVFEKFADCMNNGHTADSVEAQSFVKELQCYITENYYTCTKEILAGLGQMYVADGRFKNNIDKHAKGTAKFVWEAIKIYCK